MGKLRDSYADGGIIEMVTRETGKGGVPIAWDSRSIVVVFKGHLCISREMVGL